MKKIITTALLIAITASSAMATSYKPGHSKHGYEQAYIQMSNVAEACGMLSPVPGGSGVCAATVFENLKMDVMKTHMTYKWRNEMKKLAIAGASTSTLLIGPQGITSTLTAKYALAAKELKEKEGAKYTSFLGDK